MPCPHIVHGHVCRKIVSQIVSPCRYFVGLMLVIDENNGSILSLRALPGSSAGLHVLRSWSDLLRRTLQEAGPIGVHA